MANGAGLMGHYSTSQSALIVKQPGSQFIYYVFTLDAQAGLNGFRYSIVDMSMAAGAGSVTVKNVHLNTPSTEKLAGAYHCNGKDIWVVTHDFNSNQFRSLLVTAAGVNTVPVLSSVGSTVTGININTIGCMRISHNGRKLAIANYSLVELFDFDPSTGSVSNALTLTPIPGAYGCEFSPDGSKLYASGLSSYRLFQWDMCAATNSAIIASQFTIGTQQAALGYLKLAPDGKIYGARFLKQTLGVINNPNGSWASCNFVELGLSLGTHTCMHGLPNSVGGEKKPDPAAFTLTSSCLTYNFSSPPIPVFSACAPSNFTLASRSWLFGDPASGVANSSALSSPAHTFSGPGTYTVSLINFYYCTSDTVRQVVTITGTPTLAIAGPTLICNGDKRTYTVTGAGNYNWSGSTITTPSISLSPTTTSVYSVTGSNSLGCTSTKVFTINVKICTDMGEIQTTTPLKFYPSIGNGKFTFENEFPTMLQIHNPVGIIILEGFYEKGKHLIDLERFSNGIYLIKPLNERLRSTRIIKTD